INKIRFSIRILFYVIIFGLFFGVPSAIINGLFFGWFIEYQRIIWCSIEQKIVWIYRILAAFIFSITKIVAGMMMGWYEGYSAGDTIISIIIVFFINWAIINTFSRKSKLEIIEKLYFDGNAFKIAFKNIWLITTIISTLFVYPNNLRLYFYLVQKDVNLKKLIKSKLTIQLSQLNKNKSLLILTFILSISSANSAPLIIGLFIGVIWGLFSGLKTQEKEVKKIPNQGTWKSAINALITGIIYALFWVSVVFIVTLLYNSLSNSEVKALEKEECLYYIQNSWVLFKTGITGLISQKICNYQYINIGRIQININHHIYTINMMIYFGLIGWIIGGGNTCIQHFVVRLIFYFKGYIPWNYALFLDYSTERLFLQRVGGRYRFIHKMVQEHFADMEFNSNTNYS
ncbi:MAG: hypothetical protein AAF195_03685, partial [Pseudomonadota bacterium]